MNQDMHPTVTQLRENLASPDAFRTWLAGQSKTVFGYSVGKGGMTSWGMPDAGAENCTPLAAYMALGPLAGQARSTLSDTTHAYWWIEGQAYALMLPEWARALQNALGMLGTRAGKEVLKQLDAVIEASNET